jgi:hypothetical protein
MVANIMPNPLYQKLLLVSDGYGLEYNFISIIAQGYTVFTVQIYTVACKRL